MNHTPERAPAEHESSTTSAVHGFHYLHCLKRHWYPYLRDRWDHRITRENKQTPANAYRVMSELIEFANHLRRLRFVELGGELWAADSRLEIEIPGMSAATIRTALDFLARFELVDIQISGTGRASRRDIWLRLDVVLAFPRVAGVPDDRQPRPRARNAAPGPNNAAPCRDTDPADPLRVHIARSPRARDLDTTDQDSGYRPEPEPDPDPDVDSVPDPATVGQPSVVDRPSADEFAAAAPAIRAWRTHDACDPRRHARNGRRDVDVIATDLDYLAVRAAASAVLDHGGDASRVARAVAINMREYHPSMDAGRGSRFVGTFGWHFAALTDARNAAELAQEAQDAVSTSGSCPNSPQIDPDIPDQHEIDTRTAVAERVDGMSVDQMRAALGELDVGAAGSRMLVRLRLIDAITAAGA